MAVGNERRHRGPATRRISRLALLHEQLHLLPALIWGAVVASLSTPGKIRGGFLRFLYLLAHRRTQRDFASLGDDGG